MVMEKPKRKLKHLSRPLFSKTQNREASITKLFKKNLNQIHKNKQPNNQNIYFRWVAITVNKNIN